MIRWKKDDGQSLVEFALVLPILLVVCFGIVEMGRMTWAWNMAQQAAAEGARRAIVISDGAWADTAQAAARRRLWFFAGDRAAGMLKDVTITPTLDKTTTPATVTVNVDVPVGLLINFGKAISKSGSFSNLTYTIHGHARMEVQPAFHDNGT